MKKNFFQIKTSRLFGIGLATLGAVSVLASANVRANIEAKAEDGGVPTVASLFTADENVTLTTNVDTPSYVAVKQNGVHVSSPAGARVYYNNIIDVTDMTQESVLFEVQITPNAVGVSEFNQLLVRLEDVEDPKSFVEISMYRYYYNDSSADRTAHISVKPDSVEIFNGRYYRNQVKDVEELVFEEKFDEESGEMVKVPVIDEKTGEQKTQIVKQDNVDYYLREGVRQSTMVQGPFAGAKGGWSNSMKLYYNDAEKTVYTKDSSLWSPNMATGILTEFGFADEEGRVAVLDMDTAADMGINKTAIWDGFPSGKVKLSIQSNELLGDGNANYMILQIDGQKFDGEYLNDITAPDLSVDLLGYDEEELPLAKVGKKYPFFPATAVDKMYGDLEVKANVYKDGNLLYTTGDGFIPETAGDYVVEFVASDGNRNETIERFTVTAVENSAAIEGTLDTTDSLELNETGATAVKLYYPVRLPTMLASGGNGKVEVKTEIFFNGKKQAITDGTFSPQATGEYLLKYTLSDYIGNVRTYEYVLEAAFEDAPRLIEPVLPDYFSVGKSALLPAVQSELYTVWKQKIATVDKIIVYKADQTTVIATFDGSKEAVYVPQASDGESVWVVYSTAKDDSSTPVTFGKEITLLPSDELSDKFVMSEGVSMEMAAEGDAFDFLFTADGQKVQFTGKLSIHAGLRLEFNVPAGKNAYGVVVFKIVDANDPTNFVTVRFYKNPDETARTSFVSVNDSEKASFPASFHGNVSDYFIFTLSQDGLLYNYNDDVVLAADSFKGFTSGYVYVEMGVEEVTATDENKAAVSWVAIKNQNFNEVSEYRDLIAPILTVFEEPVGLAEIGEELFISGACANDVYDEELSLTVTVTFGEAEVFTYTDQFGRFDGASFFATNYGTYTITYAAQDLAGNKVSKSYSVVIRDTVAPTLTVDGEIPTTWEKGETFKFPTVIAEDNVDLNVPVYVVIINPVNVYTLLREGDTYTPTMSGRYIVKFYCEDSRYNTTYSENYEITVQ